MQAARPTLVAILTIRLPRKKVTVQQRGFFFSLELLFFFFQNNECQHAIVGWLKGNPLEPETGELLVSMIWFIAFVLILGMKTDKIHVLRSQAVNSVIEALLAWLTDQVIDWLIDWLIDRLIDKRFWIFIQ